MIAPEDCGLPLAEEDLRSLPVSVREAELARRSIAEANRRFDLENGPLVRAHLWQLDDQTHQLMITMHHIACDGWSVDILLRELAILYTAYCNGQINPLPPLPVQYADATAWQMQQLSESRRANLAAFWRSRLEGAPALLTLPLDRTRPATQQYAGNTLSFTLDASRLVALRTLAARHCATLFMTLMTGWGTLLGRLSAQSDVVVGLPVAHRQRPDFEGVVGFFTNTLALRIRMEHDPTVAQLLCQVRDETLAAIEHQDLPFDQIVQALELPRSPAHNPLFQVMFALNSGGEVSMASMSGLQVRSMPLLRDSARLDVSLSLVERGEIIEGTLEYASALFEPATAQRMLEQWLTVLDAMVANDACCISRLPMLPEAQRRQVLQDFNHRSEVGRRPADHHFPQLLHELFEAQVVHRPDDTALIFDSTHMSYGELNERANRLAHRLLELGIKPDDRVALCLPRGPLMVIGLLGILKAGGAYVPLDPASPAARLKYMLDDCGAVALVAQQELACESGLPRLEPHDELLQRCSTENPQPRALGLEPSHLAYVIYTSGSTGQPKGVMVEHRNLHNLVAWHIAAFGLHAGTRSSSMAAVGFDASTWEIWPSLCSGGSLTLPPPGVAGDPLDLLGWWQDQDLDVSFLVTPLAELAYSSGRVNRRVRKVLIGGDRLRRWPEALPEGQSLINNYGPTESTVVATSGRLDTGDAVPHIGRPIDNTSVYILDSSSQLVPIGVSGEIYIGGAGVARGYLNRPELTAERFMTDPFVAGGRMYRTGDLGRWRSDGLIEYVGRNDLQVKMRGLRIELGEIEARLLECQGVREAVVLAREYGGEEDRRLVGYVVEQPGATCEPGRLREQLAGNLPAYMVPGAFVRLPALPLTPNGKVDRMALPEPDGLSLALREYEAPQGDLEEAVAGVWQQLLHLPRIGRHDQFFELGGNSLLGLQLVSRLRSTLGLDVALRDVFAQPVLSHLAAALASPRPKLGVNLVTVRADGAQRPLFLVHPVEGELQYAHALADCLPPDLPVHGFVANGIQPGEVPQDCVETIAATYLPQLLAIQTQGPYRLAGWSAGGTIAHELAYQLERRGEVVEFLGLLDTSATYEAIAADFDAVGALQDWMPSPLPPPQAGALRRVHAAAGLDAMLRRCDATQLLPAGIDLGLVGRHLEVRAAIVHALRRHRLSRVTVPIHLFVAMHQRRLQADIGWSAIAGQNMRVTRVPGDHRSMMRPPHIRELALAISNALDQPTA